MRETRIGITITETAFLFALALGLVNPLLFSQSPATNRPELDHTTVFVRDIQKSVDFYEKVVGLEKITDPFKDGKHIWFRSGAHQQLHVVAGATGVAQHDIEIHTAFRVASLTDFMAHLDQMQVKYRNFKGDGKISARPDGVRQIYFQDPDGYWIEVNEDKY